MCVCSFVCSKEFLDRLLVVAAVLPTSVAACTGGSTGIRGGSHDPPQPSESIPKWEPSLIGVMWWESHCGSRPLFLCTLLYRLRCWMRACGLSHNALLCVTHRFCVDMDTTKHTIIDRGDASLAVFVCPTEYHRGRLLRRRRPPVMQGRSLHKQFDSTIIKVQRVQRCWKTHTASCWRVPMFSTM